ncbi:MAG: PilN domain-containing protein [Methanoregulaceae archaeon]|nr:PilN domain-containing protein [Methanoregulaceae archaeon]
MPLINLIQDQRLAAKKSERAARVFFMSFATVGTLSVLSFGFLLVLKETAENEASDLRVKAQQVQPILDEVEATNSEYNKLAPRVTTLTGAQETSTRWNRVLAHLAVHTPTETWLTTMRAMQSDVKKPVALTFQGLSKRQELVGEFILRLQGSTDLANVGLKFTQEKPAQAGNQIEFEVNAELEGTVEAQERNETKKEGKSA